MIIIKQSYFVHAKVIKVSTSPFESWQFTRSPDVSLHFLTSLQSAGYTVQSHFKAKGTDIFMNVCDQQKLTECARNKLTILSFMRSVILSLVEMHPSTYMKYEERRLLIKKLNLDSVQRQNTRCSKLHFTYPTVALHNEKGKCQEIRAINLLQDDNRQDADSGGN